ncbi:type 4a pilus biogenesis protein PilO [Campylobacter hominis]|uniref:type 4a pilus biogenesis protein PilO n=1 Tax=Campylobacter hominis TaxID=76517 RepID=UPI00248BE693|nr:type 4a pilus biogenesis protein PilO [Campylobacter hominis]
MKNNKNIFDQIDEFFATKKESDVKNYIVIALVLMVVIVYFAISPYSDEYFEAKEGALKDITAKLAKTDSDLASLSGPTGQDRNYMINENKGILSTDTLKLKNVRDSNRYFDAKLREVTNLTYSQENWAAFLDSLTALAENNNIKLKSLESEKQEITLQKIEPVLNITLNLEGDFNNLLRYINKVEESKMIVDINQIDFNNTHDDRIGGKMNIAIWGMKYQ